MPLLLPQREAHCVNGHRMLFRTMPLLPDMEKVTLMGCNEESCTQSVLYRLKQMAASVGIQTDIDQHNE